MINGHDPTRQLDIEERTDEIILRWGDDPLVLVPDQAIELGRVLIQYGHHAKTGHELPQPKVISDSSLAKLEKRVELMIANLQERKTKPKVLAQHVVNAVMREVR